MTQPTLTDAQSRCRVPTNALRWSCPEDCYNFQDTSELPLPAKIIAQDTAREALEYALATTALCQNVYVRGMRGTGRRTMVHSVLKTIERDQIPERLDRCYVNNFAQPDRPRLISLPAGQARPFRRSMRTLASFIRDDVPKALEGEPLASERLALQQAIENRIKRITQPLEEDLLAAGMALVNLQQGPVANTFIFPIINGEPVPPAQLKTMIQKGEADAKLLETFEAQLPEFQKRLQTTSNEVSAAQREGSERIRALTEQAARQLIEQGVLTVKAEFEGEKLHAHLDELVDDVIDTYMTANSQPPDPEERYGVNIVLEHSSDGRAQVVEEVTPTLTNLLGTIEVDWDREGPSAPTYAGIRAGALLRADDGYLVLSVRDLLAEPGAWRALMRTLRTGKLEIVPPEVQWFRPQILLTPEPIDISVRVVLIGDTRTYYMLDAVDPDFGELFKVLADFDSELPRDEEGITHYATVIAHMAREENLRPFSRDAVAALTEHGARIASRKDKLTARFGRLGDLAREASFLAGQEDKAVVEAGHVYSAVKRTKKRASLPSRRFQELIHSGTIRVETTGEETGQINGLAVISAGPIVYGFPARITSTVGVGQAGLINIEGTASLSGSIHTKGFQILGGLLRHLLKAEHPLAFSASIAFEQSYGGIDGDSASGAEACCLLSALTEIPIRQSLAMTGAIDQKGHIQAIGGVNEKIEGFYDTCAHFGLTGDQGVIIPHSNASDLMLRRDVVEACREGKFHVYAVETIQDALEILTGVPAGEWQPGGGKDSEDGKGGEERGGYQPGTLLGRAVEQVRQYWLKARQGPSPKAEPKQATEEDSSQAPPDEIPPAEDIAASGDED